MKSMNMRDKLIAAFVLVALIPIGLLALLNGRTSRQALIDDANQALFAVSAQTAAHLDAFVRSNLRAVETEASLPILAEYLDTAPDGRAIMTQELLDLLGTLADKDPDVVSYSLLDNQGINLIDTEQANIGGDYSEESYFQYFLDEGVTERAYVSPVLVSEETGDATLYFSSPIVAGDDLLGLLRVTYSANVLQRLLAEKNDQAGPGSFGVVFDEYHIHLAHGIEPDVNFIPIARIAAEETARLKAERRLPDLPDEELFIMQLDDLEEHLSNPETQRFFEATDVATGDLVNQVAIAEMETQPWFVTFFQPQTIFLAPVRAQTQNTIVLASIIAVVAVVLAVIMGQILGRPIIHLTNTVTEFTAGDLDARAHIETNDEIGVLARSFNMMAQQVGDLLQGLQARTAELGQANEEIGALNDRLKEENVRLGAEIEVTRRLQRMILPKSEELQAVDGLDIAGYMEPAEEVGGDYYDVLHENGVVKIGIGDVTDHGLESGVVMLMTQTAVRTLLNSGETDPARFLDVLNRTIYGNVQRMNSGRSVSLSLLDYTPGRVRLSGQHEEMIVVRRDSSVELVDTSDLGFPIGLDNNVANLFADTTVHLQQGDGLVLFTDGITEAENMDGEQYGLERLCQIASAHWSASAEEINESVIADVRDFIGEQEVYDDITLVVAKQQ